MTTDFVRHIGVPSQKGLSRVKQQLEHSLPLFDVLCQEFFYFPLWSFASLSDVGIKRERSGPTPKN